MFLSHFLTPWSACGFQDGVEDSGGLFVAMEGAYEPRPLMTTFYSGCSASRCPLSPWMMTIGGSYGSVTVDTTRNLQQHGLFTVAVLRISTVPWLLGVEFSGEKKSFSPSLFPLP